MKRALILCLLLISGCGQGGGSAGPGNVENGQKLFTRTCGGCHKAGPDARNSFGPQLNGIIGRHAGALPDYSYSAQMKAAGFTWDEARLKAYLAAPDKVVPGTKMYFWGLTDEQKVADILAYLKAQ
ncbi:MULTISPECIES: cytochrome c family protein [unclassified Pseudomonas]|uniref:c-type cytochrome n=1 Tax=unclassified Pseudomonas TaxID=196821 RepID=UPI000BCDC7EB|nr:MULTISPECIES: cytochrome c family protein [unclassified Pseudomonas]PVZ16515.1 cytochrome c [Pseudomonas sp. URIL14HWK12:I12]PVZ25629.1 cytochrome c [Pseudomonas sp. URIL14HWK12:I10]PVZ36847.1 cytochrome c [Pseudomonas sp. URIL14HWK12:I11]SNZ12493.1 cytochrome c [Pseudomonas sp. URIL14HWK12:I9]